MMKAGTYYVGDLCYVIADKDWNEVCKLTIVENRCIEGEFMLADGRRFAMYTTRWGDGSYYDNKRLNSYCVDSGTIGCILLDDVKDSIAATYDNIEELGAIIEFKEDFETYNNDGLIVFGDVIINTDPDEFYDEEDEYEYE